MLLCYICPAEPPASEFLLPLQVAKMIPSLFNLHSEELSVFPVALSVISYQAFNYSHISSLVYQHPCLFHWYPTKEEFQEKIIHATE